MKKALVTGASTGIGRAVAIALGRKGWFVYILARRNDKLQETKKLVDAAGGQSQVIVCDLRDLAQINRIPLAITALDLIVNIAGIWHGEGEAYAGKEFVSFDQKIITETYTVGFTAPTLIVHGLLPKMGKDSMIISLTGTFESGAKGWLPYYASKRGLEDFTKGLMEELGDKSIYVNCISPSDTATEEYQKYFPEDAKNANAPEEVASLVLTMYERRDSGKFYVIKRNQVIEDGYHK